MSSVELQSFAEITRLKNILINHKILTSEIIKKQYNFEFSVLEDKSQVKVQVYFGKKGVKVVTQGDQTSTLYSKINNIIFEQTEINFEEKEFDEPDVYIGSDESGKGDFFGPLVIAAVYVDGKTKSDLLKIKVRDSKTISDEQISVLAKKIKSIVDTQYSIEVIVPSVYNEMYTETKNLNKLLNMLHSKAIANVLDNTKCNVVITDKFSSSELEISNSSKYSNVKFLQTPRAEKYVGVAAASILARDAFNKWFELLEKNGLIFPKGASDLVTLAAKKLLKSVGETDMKNYVKTHFKIMNKL